MVLNGVRILSTMEKWAGLYKVGYQFLYVNRGFRHRGFPRRVGIYPEITVMGFRKYKKLI